MDSSNIGPHTEDSDSSISANDHIVANGVVDSRPASPTSTASTESMPPLDDVGPTGPISSTSGYWHITLIEASATHSSESSLNELPVIESQFIGGAVSDDSKYRHPVASDSDTNTNQDMFSDLCDAIRPHTYIRI